MLDKLEEYEILADRLIVKWTASVDIAKKIESGYFKKYIERYEYHFKCSDIGNSILEELMIKDRKPA